MVEMSLWIPVCLVEAWLLSSGILGFLLWRARRRQRALQTAIETLRQTQSTHTPTAASMAAEHATDPGNLAETQRGEQEALRRVAELLDTEDDIETTMRQLQETSATLQRLLDTAQEQLRQVTSDEEKVHVLERMLRDAKGSVALLHHTDAYMQQRFQEQRRQFRRCVDELRGSIRQRAVLEASVQQLQAANAQLMRELRDKQVLLEDLGSKSAAAQAQGEAPGAARQREFDTVKNQLAQRAADVVRLQEQYDHLSEDYRQLLQSSRS